jgi:hypothetical protein
MTVNYAAKYDSKVVERFKLKSLTEAAVNRDYEWSGVDTVNVYTVPTVALQDYTISGAARYGTSTEQATTIQTMKVLKDRGYSITIDKKTIQDTPLATLAGKTLAIQTDEVIIPEIDVYRLAAMSAAAITNLATQTLAITKSNAYLAILAAQEWFGNKKVPLAGKICFCTYSFYSFLKQDPSFLMASEIAVEKRINGQMGECDGIKIVPVPSTYMPATVAFIIAHPSATVAVKKLEDYKTHDNPPGISGALLEGRVRYDAFVLTTKVDGIYSHKISV